MSNHNAAGLLDAITVKLKLKNDAALARKLDIAPSFISKVRSGKRPVGDSTILRIHEFAGMSLPEIRQFVPRVVV